ncbi:hypothetical protein [Granulosicoccus antarcticus]|uniref:Uncharacterized protein n=1 Tax=Granulosicoccus antarcticus IMCC3135 TaxID=1192854 RepID=A0A2Z2NNJ8_9GAMM|nr:hypothetical protein [Granulosicoccus antarcticus]ASJ71511.1 hypothetical protein IMCC3135_07025 [Granulosicoccus antarcticus IMCC3135]
MHAQTCPLEKPRHTFSSIILASISIIGLNSALDAAPIVDGLTIQLPDDGWYQVQSADDYQEICSGVRSCQVTAGNYIVINHTTGERFEQVRAGLDETQLTVDNNTISWPDNGWYQVQNADTFESVCQGGLSCLVTAGNYIVINHTTSQRWENIVITGDNDAPLQAVDLRYERYSSTAIELFWAHPAGAQLPITYTIFQDDIQVGTTQGLSWFVEELDDDQTQSFLIKPFDAAQGVSISVPASTESHSPDGDSILSLANAEQIVKEVVAVINEEAIDAIFDNAAQDLKFQNKTFYISNTIDDIVFLEGGEQNPAYPLENQYGEGDYYDATRYSAYSCAAGGGIKLYSAYEVNASDTVFDNCVAGSNIYNGTTGIRNVQRGVINQYPVYDFSVTDSSGNTQTLSGGYASGNLSFVAFNSESGWHSASYRGAFENGQLEIDDYSVVRTHIDNNSAFSSTTRPGDDGELIRIVEYRVANSVTGQFEVHAPWSNEQHLRVFVALNFSDDAVITTDPETGEPVAYSGASPEEPFFWQSGSIEVQADDGTHLSVTPVEGERDTFMITTGDGETMGPLLWQDGYTVQP